METMSLSEHEEGPIAPAVVEQTANSASDRFLWLAGGSIAASLALNMLGQNRTARFVGQWAPTFLMLGLYKKIVKVAGSD